jgi:ABC-type transport system substrate-binding protein
VPARTPVLRSGLNPDPPVSGAGPYYIASKIHRRLVILKKNPNYPGPRPQPWDAITFQMDVAPNLAIDRVLRGEADAFQISPWEPLGGATSNLAQQWGPWSTAAEADDQRWFGAEKHGTRYFALNPSSPAFSDPTVRQAVALALDRTAFADIWVEGPSTKLLSPAVAAASWPIEPVPAPDLAAARALMNGRTFTIQIPGDPEGNDCDECRAFEVAVIGQLAAIGITVEVKRAEWELDEIFKPASDIDLIDLGTWTDLADPVDALRDLHDDQWLDSATIAELDALEDLTGQARIDGAVTLANRLVDGDYLVIPMSHAVFPFFIAERLGCGFVQPAVGALDLLSLCVDGAAP